MKLPAVSGSNLLRRKIRFPDDLRGSLNILFIPFQQWQQLEVNSWVPLVSEFEQAHPDLRYYELPTIQRRNILSQTFINEGMRAGIPDPSTRERTVTLYIDKKAFMLALGMPDEEHMHILLTDQQGNILWRSFGAYSLEKAESLAHAIQAVNLSGKAA